MAAAFLAKGQPFKRKILRAEQTFHAAPEVVFRQFCPTREVDWIDGWQADLLHTESGYMEPECIFRTPASNILGPGLWVVARLEPNELLDIVRLIDENVVEHFRIDLEDHGDGTCTGRWTLNFAAISERGNAMIDDLTTDDPLFARIIAGLEHFV
ncbi:MAG: hypothetical protein ACF8NJ_06525, partial [Phycisphaerales bacterium JB038]